MSEAKQGPVLLIHGGAGTILKGEVSPEREQIIRDAGSLAVNLGRPEEALALLRRAVVLDPLSASAHRALARECYFAGLLDDAEVAGQKSLELNAQGVLTHYWLGLVCLRQGHLDESLELFQREPHDTFRLLGLSQVLQARGQSAESEAALKELIDKDAAGAAYQIALGYAYRGETDLAFEWLERAYVQRDPGISMMRISESLHKLHSDPRWQPFLEKMGLAG